MVFESLEPRILMSADLMPVSAGLSSSGSIYAGDSISALMQVNRQGTDAIGVPVRIQFYASTDSVLDNSDVSIGQVDVPVGQLPTGTNTVAVPLDTSTIARPGSYRLIGVVDPANTIAESDETNNRVVSNQMLDLRFVVGQIPGRAAIPSITLTDADGTRFTLRFFVEVFRPPYHLRELIAQCYAIGYLSLPLVTLTGFVTGLVFTKQSRPSLAAFGATSWLPSLITSMLLPGNCSANASASAMDGASA